MRAYLFTFLATFFALNLFSQSKDLSLKLEIGEEYIQSSQIITIINQEVDGKTMETKMTMGGSMVFEVEDIVGGAYLMSVSFEELNMSMESPQGSMQANSNSDNPNDVFSMIFAEMVDQPFELTLSNKGKVSNIKNVEELWANAVDQFEQLSEEQRKQIKAEIMKSYGPESLKKSIETSLAIYPDKAVSKKEEWNIKSRMETLYAVDVNATYNYEETSNGKDLIRGKSTLKTVDNDSFVLVNKIPMKYDLKGTANYEIWVDSKTGWILEAKITQNVEGTCFIKESEDLPNGLLIPMVLKINTTCGN